MGIRWGYEEGTTDKRHAWHRQLRRPPEKFVRRTVPADLIEATPGGNGVGQWIWPHLSCSSGLALPISLICSAHLRIVLSMSLLGRFFILLVLIVLPLGLLTHRLILSLPRIFQHAGWDVRPLEPVRPEEMYTVRYRYQARHLADTTWSRRWLRVAQGWVYLWRSSLSLSARAVMIPLFLSAVEFGFGQ
ncbi:MAG: hypothetical protein R2867_32980 [Caldilineaceae bacterium]